MKIIKLLLFSLIILSCNKDDPINPTEGTYLEKTFVVTDITGDHQTCDRSRFYMFNTLGIVTVEYGNTTCILLNGVETFSYSQFGSDSLEISRIPYKFQYVEPKGTQETFLTLWGKDRIIKLKHNRLWAE